MTKKYDNIVTKITYIAAAIVILLIVFFLFVKPYFTFKSYENKMEKAAERYFDVNQDKLPTGNRTATVTLKQLQNQKYIDEDFYVPLSKKVCDLEESWVKLKTDGSDYKKYVYLSCGYMESKVDHEGPEINLKGEKEMTVTRFTKFTDPGINSVIDKTDGKISIDKVKIDNSVDTQKTGKYKIVYTAYDSLQNKSTIERKVTVIDTITSITKRESKIGYYTSNTPNNYIYFNNSLYRIIGIDGDNVRIVSDIPVGFINYAGLDKYIEKYYNSLSNKSKKLLVDNKYCNDTLSKNNLDTTECSAYTDPRKVFIPSVMDVNKTKGRESSYITGNVAIWLGNKLDNDYAYVNKIEFIDADNDIKSISINNNMGFKPVVTIKGNSLISEGNGTADNPYRLDGDLYPAKTGTTVNKRYGGEYITIDNKLWRIIEQQEDGTTKVILETMLSSDNSIAYFNNIGSIEKYVYNPKKVNTYAYFINNKATEYISMKNFVSNKVLVPIYKKDILYGKEVSTKEYKVKLAAPNVYDLYSVSNSYTRDYLFANEIKGNVVAVLLEDGTLADMRYNYLDKYYVRPVAFLKAEIKIVSGKGIYDNPYVIK